MSIGYFFAGFFALCSIVFFWGQTAHNRAQHPTSAWKQYSVSVVTRYSINVPGMEKYYIEETRTQGKDTTFVAKLYNHNAGKWDLYDHTYTFADAEKAIMEHAGKKTMEKGIDWEEVE